MWIRSDPNPHLVFPRPLVQQKRVLIRQQDRKLPTQPPSSLYLLPSVRGEGSREVSQCSLVVRSLAESRSLSDPAIPLSQATINPAEFLRSPTSTAMPLAEGFQELPQMRRHESAPVVFATSTLLGISPHRVRKRCVPLPRKFVSHIGSNVSERIGAEFSGPRSSAEGTLCAEEFYAPSLYAIACARMNLLPKFARAARSALNGGEFDITGLGVGNEHLKALLEDIELVPLQRISRWRLKDSKLDDEGVSALASVLGGHLELLDLSSNKFGVAGCTALGTFVSEKYVPALTRLDLSCCGLKDAAAAFLFRALIHCHSLVRLDLNNNCLQDGSSLGSFVGGHSRLMRLSLSKNSLMAEGAYHLFRGVLENARRCGQLADLDVAWNRMGFSGETALNCATVIAEVFAEPSALFHCDLSYNYFDASSCSLIGEGLKDNHSLYGLHIVGNAATMDANGFLLPLVDWRAPPLGLNGISESFDPLHSEESLDLLVGCLPTTTYGYPTDPNLPAAACVTSPSACRYRNRGVFRKSEDMDGRDVLEKQAGCWACDGWEYIELEWPVSTSRPDPEPKAVFVFTSVDNFRHGLRAKRIERSPVDKSSATKVCFVAARMIPPAHDLLAVFQIDGSLQLFPGAEVVTLDPPVERSLLGCKELPEPRPPPDHEVVVSTSAGQISNPVVRVRAAGRVVAPWRHGHRSCAELGPTGRKVVLLDGSHGGCPVNMPRVILKEYCPPRPRPRPYYSGYRRECSAALRDALCVDWSRCRLKAMLSSDDAPLVKSLLELRYDHVIALYRHLSSMDAIDLSTSFCIQRPRMADVLVAAGLANDKVTRRSDIDRIFIASKVTPVEMRKGFVVICEKALVRYEFLECLIRIALQRFFHTGACTTVVESVQRMLDALAPRSQQLLDEREFIFNALTDDAVDEVFRKHSLVLHSSFRRCTKIDHLCGEARSCHLQDFHGLLQGLNFYDGSFKTCSAGYAFRLGMETQVDENLFSRFQEMNFIEFQLALGIVVMMVAGLKTEKLPVVLDVFFSRLASAFPRRR